MKRERDSEREAHCLALLLFTVSLIRARNTFIIQNKTSYLQFIKKKKNKQRREKTQEILNACASFPSGDAEGK